MPDREAPTSLSYNTFTAGEVSPGIYGRQDLQKYKAGCVTMRNWYVDAKGGATIRPGTQFLGHPARAGYVRLVPFHFSPAVGQTYLLVFSDNLIEFVKNPGTAHYSNSSNAGFMSGVSVATDYAGADLRNLHYVQIADVLWITCKGHPRRTLTRMSDTSWIFDDVSDLRPIGYPTITSVDISLLGAGLAAVPSETHYGYRVAAVSIDGDEGWASSSYFSAAGINIGATQGTVTVTWTPVAGAAYYKVYKCLPSHGNRIPGYHEQFGFAGFSYGTTFDDSNIVPDFTHTPMVLGNPFTQGQIIGYTILSPGSGYPIGGTELDVTDSTGYDGLIYPIFDNNISGGTAGITGIWIASPGGNYTAPTVTAVGAGGSGFSATLIVSPHSGTDPHVVGLMQQRLVYATTDLKPNSIFASRPGAPDDFRKTNPTIDSDAFEFGIFDQQVTQINWLRSMPGGLLIGTDNGVIQLTGGSSSAANPAAITPTNAVIVPQSFFGTAANIQPIVIDYNVLFVQREGIVRDLQYNFFANIYVGTDLTVLSNHLFEGRRIVDWAYQDSPNKIVWCVQDNGQLLSLTYLKAQEVAGWARHDTNGTVESIASVHEDDVNAIYLSVVRNGMRCIERQTQQLLFQDSDVWQLDSALSTPPSFAMADLSVAARDGHEVLAVASTDVFLEEHIGATLSGVTGRAKIIDRLSPCEAVLDVEYPFLLTHLRQGLWEINPLVSSLSGLGHLEGMSVMALVDGTAQGPFTVSGGSVTLTAPGTRVVVGLAYTAQLHPLYLDVSGEQTIQGKRKKIAAASVRVHNAKGLYYGPDFASLIRWTEGISSTDPNQGLPYQASGLFSGDQRLWLDQIFAIGGWVCISQPNPYPATILSIYPEMAQGDVT